MWAPSVNGLLYHSVKQIVAGGANVYIEIRLFFNFKQFVSI